jgi:hypothetical protein
MIRERGNSGQTWEKVGRKLPAPVSSGSFEGDNPRDSVSFFFAIPPAVLDES